MSLMSERPPSGIQHFKEDEGGFYLLSIDWLINSITYITNTIDYWNDWKKLNFKDGWGMSYKEGFKL